MASRYHFMKPQPSFGENVGSALGTGLGKALTGFAETKLDNMIKKHKQGEIKNQLISIGIPDYQAEFVSRQDPETVWQVARDWFIAGGGPAQAVPTSINQPWNYYDENPEQPQGAMGALQQPIAQQPQTAADLITQQGPMSPFMRDALAKQQLPQQQSAMQALQQPMAPREQAQAPSAMQALGMQPQQQMQGRPKDIGEAMRNAQQLKKGKTPADQELAELKKEKLRQEVESMKKGTGKISPDAQDFLVKTESKARTARPLLHDLNEIDEYIDKHEKDIQTSLFAAHAPTSMLNEPTRKMKQKMSKILTEMIQADAQGRGSDLMRRIISEGKLELQQGPTVWREVINELREEQEDNLQLDEIKNDIRRTLGNVPDDIGELARSQLAQEKTEFNTLPDSEKINYLFSNPGKMKWITEITDENGKVIARRSKDGWRKVAR